MSNRYIDKRAYFIEEYYVEFVKVEVYFLLGRIPHGMPIDTSGDSIMRLEAPSRSTLISSIPDTN